MFHVASSGCVNLPSHVAFDVPGGASGSVIDGGASTSGCCCEPGLLHPTTPTTTAKSILIAPFVPTSAMHDQRQIVQPVARLSDEGLEPDRVVGLDPVDAAGDETLDFGGRHGARRDGLSRRRTERKQRVGADREA